MWSLISGESEEDKQAEELKRKIQSLQFAKIPGYFPTPEPVIDLMIAHAMIDTRMGNLHYEDLSILEPSAGSGAIADRIKADYPGCHLDVFEVWHSLQDILKAKGHKLMGSDFLDFEAMPLWDFILMNPPFEKMQDVDHVLHAFRCLKPGGRLVSIMSPSPFFNSNKKAVEFREWFDELGGEVQDIPEGSFKESGTGVSARIIIIDK